MITQLGSPTLFFTLSAADTKWPDLHTLMPRNSEGHSLNAHLRNIENVVNYPHVVAMYMHHRFNIFREEVLEKYFHAKDFWYRFLNLFHFKTYLLFFGTYIFIIFLHFIFFRYEW